MSETIIVHEGKVEWHARNIEQDLKVQAEIHIAIDINSINAFGCSGIFENVCFRLAWVYQKFLVVEMSEYSEQLVKAFSTVLETPAHFRYRRNGIPVVEWAFIEPIIRHDRLLEMNHISEVKIIGDIT